MKFCQNIFTVNSKLVLPNYDVGTKMTLKYKTATTLKPTILTRLESNLPQLSRKKSFTLVAVSLSAQNGDCWNSERQQSVGNADNDETVLKARNFLTFGMCELQISSVSIIWVSLTRHCTSKAARFDYFGAD